MERRAGTTMDNDLIRLGVYTQMEGSVSTVHGGAQFTFFTRQIEDMTELCSRVAEKELSVYKGYVRIYSKKLLETLNYMGFESFHPWNWNVLRDIDEEDEVEYLRAIIDSIGNVDIDRKTPYIQLSSINQVALRELNRKFGGKLRGPYASQNSERLFLLWKGRTALELLERLDWTFHNARNQRGAAIIRMVRWEDSLV